MPNACTFEILIMVLMGVLLIFQVNNTTGAGGIPMKGFKPGKVNEEKYVQYVAAKPILSMPQGQVQFDGDVFFAEHDMAWDWNDSEQLPTRSPSLYLADPFINIQHAPGLFQPM